MTTKSLSRSTSVSKTATAPTPPSRFPVPEEATYALQRWTMKISGGKWWIAPTVYHGAKPVWYGPYDSVKNATFAIGRALAAEVNERHVRR